MRSRTVLPAFALLVLAAVASAAAQETPPPPPPAAVPELTPKVPPLAVRLAALLRTPAFHPQETGMAVLLLPEGTPLFERNADRPLKPASTLKILTSAAALSLLRPEYAFETRLLVDAPIAADGTLQGNLYLQGFGAPDLVGESWWLMARRLYDLGLRRVEGKVVADESYFDTVRRPPGWPAPAADSWYNAPVGALSCNFNVVTVRVAPSPLLGGRPDLILEPSPSFFQVLNRATTVTGGTSIVVARGYEEGRNTLTISGTIRRGSSDVVANRAVEDPPLYALHAFRDIARGAGIEIAGTLETGSVPAGAREVHRHTSRPLAALLLDMNKNSNNFMAEMVLKTLGAQFVGIPGTTAAGITVLRTYLLGIGLDATPATLADGSGLSDQNRMPARLLVDLLARARADFEIGPELVASLPIGGADGTLDGRFGGEESRRRVRAKTGRVAGALALAGYAANRDGREFAFAVLANQARGSLEAVHHALDRLVDALVTSTEADLVIAGS